MSVTLAGFLAFVRDQVAITEADLPSASPSIQFALDLAVATVNEALACVPIGTQPGLTVYDVAVYNLAADNLINYARDTSAALAAAEAKTAAAGKPVLPFFAALRSKWGIDAFRAGVVNSTSDNSTSTSLTVPEALARLTLADLQNLKTPYGRTYLQLAQAYGPSIWGLS